MLASVAGYAQHEVGTVTIQPKVGLNVATLTNYDKADPRLGLAAGAELEYQLTDIMSLSAGALYSMQGYKTSVSQGKISITNTHKVDYVNVPVMCNVYVVNGLAVKLGVQPGFKVNSKNDFKANTILGKASESFDMKAKSVDFSIPVGLSYEYSNFVLDARYNFGVTKVFENSDTKNSVFQFTLGYKFEL